jgi:hypothetical protein
MGGIGLSDEPSVQVLIEEFLEGLHLGFRQGVHSSEGRRSTFFEVNLEIVVSVRRKCTSTGFAEHVSELVVDFGNRRHIYFFSSSGASFDSVGRRQSQGEQSVIRSSRKAGISGSVDKGN